MSCIPSPRRADTPAAYTLRYIEFSYSVSRDPHPIQKTTDDAPEACSKSSAARMFSPQPCTAPGTPVSRPTEKAVKLAQDGLEQAEALENQGLIREANAMKAAALVDAAALYKRGKKLLVHVPGESPRDVNFHFVGEMLFP
jgi:hypothetical protein